MQRVLLILTFIALSFVATAQAPRALTFASLNYCPLICDPKLEPSGLKGLMVDVLELIFRAEGYDIEVVLMPFKRAIKEAGEGQYDGLIGGDVFQAPSMVYPKQPIITNHAQIFALKGKKWRFSGVSSLKKIRLISVKEFGYANQEIDHYLATAKGGKVIRMIGGGDPYTLRAIRLLSKDSGDAYIDGHLVFQYITSQEELKGQFEAVSPALGAFKNYVSFSSKRKDASELAAIVDKHLPRLKESGEMDQILLKYGIISK